MLYKINPSSLRRLFTQIQTDKILLPLSCLCMTNLAEVFPCFFFSCKANVRVNPRKEGARPALFLSFVCSMYFCVVFCIVCFVSFSVLFVCICVLNYCHRVATQLQLNISYHISLCLCHRISCACAYSIVPRAWSSPTCSQINAPLSGIYFPSDGQDRRGLHVPFR